MKIIPWHQSEVGARLIDEEKNELKEILTRLCGYHLVFLGDPALAVLCQKSLISHRVVLSGDPLLSTYVKEEEGLSAIQGETDSLPLLSESVDAILLCHTLEHHDNPHEVLRETHRALIPEGHIVITGFNPFSLWGLWHFVQKCRKSVNPQGKLLPINRLRDWLKLLNFQIISIKPFYYRPPVGSQKAYQTFGFFEKWLNFKIFAGAYTILAVKRVVTLTPVRVKWKTESTVWQPVSDAIPKPSATKLGSLESNE